MSGTQKYQKLTQREHLLKRPGMYMGDIGNKEDIMWIYKDGSMSRKNIVYNSGILKLFDEIIMNAADHARETGKVNEISVEVTSSKISVYNDGPGIPIEKAKEYGNIYIPQMIFRSF